MLLEPLLTIQQELLRASNHIKLFAPANATPDAFSKNTMGWQWASKPFALTGAQAEFLGQLGAYLWEWVQAQEALYNQHAWVRQILDAGKPEGLTAFAKEPKQQGQAPRVLRPDLLLTENGFALCELDSVPGGLGFTSALNTLYKQVGFSVQESASILEGAFAQWLYGLVLEQYRNNEPSGNSAPNSAPNNEPFFEVAILLSEEAKDYTLELSYLVESIQRWQQSNALPLRLRLLAPEALQEGENGQLGFEDETTKAFVKLDAVYRFYELFDRANIANLALLEKALANKTVWMTPPSRPFFEEKAWLALLHHPNLASEWQSHLSPKAWQALKQVVPQSWLVREEEQALLKESGLLAAKQPITQWMDLANASQKERQLVLKPSGFSPLAWGSRGVTIGHDVPATVWKDRLELALQHAQTTPYVLQRFEKPKTIRLNVLHPQTAEALPFEGRVRLCPYYLVHTNNQVEWVGTLATICPKDKKIIHGMQSAVMAPCQLEP